MEVGNVHIEDRYLAGRQEANKLIKDYFALTGSAWEEVDWDTCFSDRKCDHLRPEGEYVGSRAADQDPDDDDSDELLSGSLMDIARLAQASGQNGAECDPTNFADARDELYMDDEITEAETQEKSTDQNPEPYARPAGLEVDDSLNFEPDILNPSAATQRSTPYLLVGTKQRHIDALVAERLVSERARKSTIRTLHAQGVTIDETIQHRRGQNLNSAESDAGGIDVVKCGDLGGVLVRLGDKVCLAVGEILNFRQGTSRNNLKAVNMNDLETETGPKVTSIAIQVLDLSAVPKTDGMMDFTWQWTRDYVQTLNTKDGITNKKHYTVRIPGKNFYALGPDVKVDDEDTPVWSLADSDLKSTLDDAWASLNPDADEIITNIESLPEILGTGLPYKTSTGILQLYISSVPVQLTKLTAKDKIPCRLCGEVLRLSKMRNHIGGHILRSLRTRDTEQDEEKIVDAHEIDNEVSSSKTSLIFAWNHSQSISYSQ